MIRCAVFDFDGTLVDSNAIKHDTFFRIAQAWDPSGEVVAGVLERWPSADRYEKTRKIAEGLIAGGRLPEGADVENWALQLAGDYTTECRDAIACCPEMPGVSDSLAELTGKGYLLFINSATPSEPLRQIIKLRNWTHFFQAIYGAEASKADNLRDIARTTGLTQSQIVHIGDQRDDLQATEQFGCPFVAMAAPNSGPISKISPLVIDNLGALSDLLLQLDKEMSS